MTSLWKLSYLVLVVSAVSPGWCRRPKKSQPPPPLRDQFVRHLRRDAQTTTFLRRDEHKTFYTRSTLNNSFLSITILTCSSELMWTLDWRPENTTEPADDDVDSTSVVASSSSSSSARRVTDVDTFGFWTQKGLYVINVRAAEATFAHLYVSTVIEFPLDVIQSAYAHLKATRRRRRRLSVTWSPSLVDPHVTDYCLVVNTRKPYRNLCSAQSETKSFQKDEEPEILKYDRQQTRRDLSSPKITCVGKKTHYTLNNLEKGQNYFIDLFAVNQQTNLTYPYASTKTKFDSYIKPTVLKDAKLTFVNLGKLDGKAEFIYKLENPTEDTLEFYFMPCGLIDVEVVLKHNGTKSKTKIKGFGKIQIPNPKSSKYFLRVLNRNFSDVRRSSGVKVLATTKPSKIPFPVLPTRTEVHEYISMRKCNSITIGWYSSPMKNNALYCVAVKKGRLPQVDKFELTDHCRVDYNLKSLGVSYCKEFNETNRDIIMETVDNLTPGESHIVYVSIQKKKGKALSYDLLQTHTKSECS